MSRYVGVALLTLVVSLLAGCGQDGEFTAQQSRVIQSNDPDAVLSAAATILRREFDRVHVNAAAHTLQADPVEYNTTRDSGSARDLVRGRSTMRRLARLSVSGRGGTTIARLRIDIERQDTARAAVAQPPADRFSDSPGHTPIERDAATTEEQNTVWTLVRRDERMERLLLEELQDHFATPPAETPPATQPAEHPAGGSP